MIDVSDARLQRVREAMDEQNYDVLIVTDAANVDWVTGIGQLHDEERPHALIITPAAATVVTDSRYDEIASQLLNSQHWRVIRHGGSLIDSVVSELEDASVARIALEDSMSYGDYVAWVDKLSSYEVCPARHVLEHLRWTKDAVEIEAIRRAQDITDRAFSHMVEYIEVGMSERQIAFELEFELRRQGAETLAFPSIVAGGPNGSLPHAHPGERIVAEGEFVTLDFGAQYGGYCADMTRTVCVGTPSSEMSQVYETVLAAQLAAINAIGPGVVASDVDKAARQVIEDAGYGQYFGHGTGHGVGLAIHEGPNAGPRSTDVLEPGHVITVEPGIYLPGKLGVRIEDLVVVTSDGFDNLTKSPKQLREIH